MNLGKKISAGVLALAMAVTFTGGALAAVEDGGNAEVCVAPRADSKSALSVRIDDANFGKINYDSVDRVNESTLSVNVSDNRGVVGDWTVTIQGTDFSSTNGTSFKIENLKVKDLAADPVTKPGVYITSGVATTTSAPQTLVQGDNVGTLNQTFDFTDSELNVPTGTLVGVYKSTLTVTITSGDTNSKVCEPVAVPADSGTLRPVDTVRNA